jgi:hypothetical protein
MMNEDMTLFPGKTRHSLGAGPARSLSAINEKRIRNEACAQHVVAGKLVTIANALCTSRKMWDFQTN